MPTLSTTKDPVSAVRRSSNHTSTLSYTGAMPHSEHDGPLVKRQRTTAVAKRQSASTRGSAIFAPFRVRCSLSGCGDTMLTTRTDRRARISHRSPIQLDPFGQNHLPNHNLRWPIPPDIRSQARTQSRLHHTTSNACRYYRDLLVEEEGLCRLGRQQQWRCARALDLRARKESG